MIYLVTNQTRLFKNSEEITLATLDDFTKFIDNNKEIGLDTETTGLNAISDVLILLQIGTYTDQYVIDLTSIDVEQVLPLLKDRNTYIIHNAKFDLKFLYKYKKILPNVFDTFLAEKVLHTGLDPKLLKNDLNSLVRKYAKQKLDKSVRVNIHKKGLTDQVVVYAAKDVQYLCLIKNRQVDKLKDEKLMNTIKLDNDFVKVLAYIEYCGIYLNPTKWKEKMLQDKIRLNEAEVLLHKWIIDSKLTKYIDGQLDMFSDTRKSNINWASSKQIIPLFTDLGIDTKVFDSKTGKSKHSVDATTIKPQIKKSSIIPLYLEYKKAEKVVSTYGESWLNQINPITGRIHTKFTQILNTGRMSSGGKDRNAKIDYVNIQNIPADHTRECFTNQYEHTTLVDADFSGQEQIVFANWSLDKDILQFYYDKLGDMHSFVASKIYKDIAHLPLDDIKKLHKDKRQKAKSAGFAINYGGNGTTISDNLGISKEEGEAIYNAYFEAFPGIAEYFRSCKVAAIEFGYILFNSVTGRKSYVDRFDEFVELRKVVDTPDYWERFNHAKKHNTPELKQLSIDKWRYSKWKGEIERASLNYPIQGSSADITKLAGIYLFEQIVKRGWFMEVLISNIIHDEFLLECPTILAEEVSKLVKESMEKAGAVFCKTIPLEASPIITTYWQH